ncbi:hypothetical protein [Nitrospirillum pindoramense]|uniref:Uncharacterized protein n=1 Tax=Nitrospirillum amazonense TaxID=28077 RepID=A0A560HGB0_9PROT|nr:hypothetical protein [Nitrospirillum amazonense]TWB45485.1 hypothetical protein FBZ90_102443 [Nitrospirillum amazonense]
MKFRSWVWPIILAVVLIPIIIVFFDALLCSKAGEIAGALGGLIGGLVGAGGAIYAVSLAVSSQRKEEARRVTRAINIEVAVYVKYVIGALEICNQIAKARTLLPTNQASYITKSIPIDPTVYTAVADRIGLLIHPEATVSFYARILEAKAMTEALEKKPKDVSQTMYVPSPTEHVSMKNVQPVVDVLLTALELSRPIINAEPEFRGRDVFDKLVRKRTLEQIEQAREGVRSWYPNSECFSPPPMEL